MVVNCAGIGDGGVLFPLPAKNAIHHAKGRVMYDRGKASSYMRSETHNQARQWEMVEIPFIVSKYCDMKFCQTSEGFRGMYENAIDSEAGAKGNEETY